MGDNLLFVADYLLRFLRVALLLAVWQIIFRNRGAVDGLTLPSILTYTLIAEAFSEPMQGDTGIGDAFWDGSITMRYLRPAHLFLQFGSECGGIWLINMALFSLPLLCAAPLLGVNPMPAGPAAAALFAISLILSVAVGMALDNIVAGIAVGAGIPPDAVGRSRRAVGGILSGALIPLSLMPWGIGRVLAFTPFASLASAPLQIYIGHGDALRLIGVQALWCLLLWPIAASIWTRYREKVVSYGG